MGWIERFKDWFNGCIDTRSIHCHEPIRDLHLNLLQYNWPTKWPEYYSATYAIELLISGRADRATILYNKERYAILHSNNYIKSPNPYIVYYLGNYYTIKSISVLIFQSSLFKLELTKLPDYLTSTPAQGEPIIIKKEYEGIGDIFALHDTIYVLSRAANKFMLGYSINLPVIFVDTETLKPIPFKSAKMSDCKISHQSVEDDGFIIDGKKYNSANHVLNMAKIINKPHAFYKLDDYYVLVVNSDNGRFNIKLKQI